MPTSNTKDHGAVRGSAPLRARSATANGLQRPACYMPSGGVSQRNVEPLERARHGTCCPWPAPAVTMLGKLITQRSRVQIPSPQRRPKPQVGDLRLHSRAHDLSQSTPLTSTAVVAD